MPGCRTPPDRRAFPKGLRFKPSRRLRWSRFARRWRQQVPAGRDTGGCRLWKRHAIPNRPHRTRTAICSRHRIVYATVWKPGQQPLPAPPRKPGRGAPPKRLQRDADHQPVSVRQLALDLPSSAWKDIGWRQGSRGILRSRFAAVRVRPAHRDYKRTEPHPEEWLLIEWPKEASEPTKYWLSTLPARTSLKPLVNLAKHRWIIERDYEELKQELGLGHYEGTGLAGLSPSRHSLYRGLWLSGFRAEPFFPLSPRRPCWTTRRQTRHKASGRAARRIRPERHNPHSIATLRIIIARYLVGLLPHCPCCGSRTG